MSRTFFHITVLTGFTAIELIIFFVIAYFNLRIIMRILFCGSTDMFEYPSTFNATRLQICMPSTLNATHLQFCITIRCLYMFSIFRK